MTAIEQLAKLSETQRRTATAAAYRYLAEQEQGEKAVCPTCGDRFPADTFSEINSEGKKVCARCVFVIALYLTSGIRKKLTDGCLAPHQLNSRFRRILEEEFYIQPAEAYTKYLGEMIRQEEIESRIIDIPPADFARITAGDWPFHLLCEKEFREYHIQPGVEITLRNREKIKETVTRQIYAVQRLPGKAARRYAGSPHRKYACFIPAN